MSNTDSFIDEVTEEVRRDRLFALLRRYGWIAGVVVLGIVGGAAWSEWRAAQARSQAQALGDGILAALAQETAGARAGALESLDAPGAGGAALTGFLRAAELGAQGEAAAQAEALNAIAANADVPEIYRQLAAVKSVIVRTDLSPAADRRVELSALAAPGAPLRLVAEEQLALIDIETGQPAAAITRLQAIIDDAGVDGALRDRARQLIIALGGSPTDPAGAGQ